MNKLFQFLKEARAELRKVSWPTWDEVTASTVVVFVTVILFTAFIYGLDTGIGTLVNKLLLK